MVLADLGSTITRAISKMRNTSTISEEVLDEMLKEIGNALVAADVQFQLVFKLRQNIKKAVNLAELAPGVNKHKIVQKAVFTELVNLLETNKKPFQPKRNTSNVIMFVGLQGAGKTTTVSKMAHHYKKKGWMPALICADTFRAGALEQLKQNAERIKVPFYGSRSETDPVQVAYEGVQQFKKEKYDIIIVDTSGRHKQEAALFEEMEQVARAINPDNIILVMDGTIGQAAFDQAKAFKEKVPVGSVIITKLDGNAKGGGAISAVAATDSPIIFTGSGEYMEDLDPFEARSFVSRLLGLGDVSGMMKAFQEVLPADKAPELAKRLQEGKFTLRDMREQLSNILKMGPLGKVMEMMPGNLNQLLPQLKGNEGNIKIKIMINILDSMTDKELDSDKPIKENSRLVRIARGSGRSVREVQELMEQQKQFAQMLVKMKSITKARGSNMTQKMANAVPPHLMKQMGGMGGLQSLMKQFGDLNIPGLGKK